MKITITGRKVNLRDSFKERVEKKLAKFNKVFGDDAESTVTVSLEKDRKTVEITVKSRGYIYRAEETSLDMDEALDTAVDHLARQMRKNKTKLSKRLKADPASQIFAPIEEESEAVEEEVDFQIVRSKKFPVSPMSIDEAVLQMNMLGHQFYMFRNCDTDAINVVYRRRDGNYGLIEPEE